MIKGGEDPLFLARRLIRMASEDIGLADPEALKLAVAARDSYQMLGSPEGELALAQVVLYLALCPKSNAIYSAYQKACDLAEKSSHYPPPKRILNAPTRLMKDLGYQKGYVYDTTQSLAVLDQIIFPMTCPESNYIVLSKEVLSGR
jgi:putative ATPase